MRKLSLLVLVLFLIAGCGSVQVVKSGEQPTQPASASAPVKEKIDFGDQKSETLTTKAWSALGKKDYNAVMTYTDKCFKMYSKTAKKQQKSLKYFATKEKAYNYWALNDVGVCYFIKGCAYEEQNNIEKQKEMYKILVENYYFSQCWDPNGWFWHPGEVAEEKLVEWGVSYKKATK